MGLLFMLYAAPATAGRKKHKAPPPGIVRSMTVLDIQPESNDVTYVTVIFQVSQRAYKLPKDADPAYLKLLKQSASDLSPVLVRRAKEESDVIVSVEKDPGKTK